MAPKGTILSKEKLEERAGCCHMVGIFSSLPLVLPYTFSSKTSLSKRPFEKLMALTHLPKSGLISKIYKLLIELERPTTYSFQTAWDGELEKHVTEEDWAKLRSTICFSTPLTNIQLVSFKTMYRWHLTPHYLHKIYPHLSDLC